MHMSLLCQCRGRVLASASVERKKRRELLETASLSYVTSSLIYCSFPLQRLGATRFFPPLIPRDIFMGGFAFLAAWEGSL